MNENEPHSGPCARLTNRRSVITSKNLFQLCLQLTPPTLEIGPMIRYSRVVPHTQRFLRINEHYDAVRVLSFN